MLQQLAAGMKAKQRAKNPWQPRKKPSRLERHLQGAANARPPLQVHDPQLCVAMDGLEDLASADGFKCHRLVENTASDAYRLVNIHDELGELSDEKEALRALKPLQQR